MYNHPSHDPIDWNEEEYYEPPKHMPEHWYRMYESECVLCGRGHKWRERVYGSRPENYEDRYVLEQYACCGHFL